jgi:hypothetical protein
MHLKLGAGISGDEVAVGMDNLSHHLRETPRL